MTTVANPPVPHDKRLLKLETPLIADPKNGYMSGYIAPLNLWQTGYAGNNLVWPLESWMPYSTMFRIMPIYLSKKYLHDFPPAVQKRGNELHKIDPNATYEKFAKPEDFIVLAYIYIPKVDRWFIPASDRQYQRLLERTLWYFPPKVEDKELRSDQHGMYEIMMHEPEDGPKRESKAVAFYRRQDVE